MGMSELTTKKRWFTGFAISSFWLLMMALLAQRELGVERLDVATSVTQATVASESWLGVFLADGPRVGQIHLRQRPEVRRGAQGTEMTLDANMKMLLLGKSTDLNLSGSAWNPEMGNEMDFDLAVRSSGHVFEVRGRAADGELVGEMTSAGEVLPLRLPVSDGLMLSNGLGSALRFPRLEVGDEYRFDSFDPVTLSKGEARVRCLAREVLNLGASRIETCRLQVTMNGLTSRAWVDEQGEIVRAETPVGLVLQRMTEAESRLASLGAGDFGDFLEKTSIRPRGKRPFRTAQLMSIRLAGLEALQLPEDTTQEWQGENVLHVRAPGAPGERAEKLLPELAPDERESYLASDAFIQSAHPKIRKQALMIVGDETDPWAKARAIHDWVFARLEKRAVISIPSAIEVLERRQGDCNEHTVLFTALARAVGVPTRIAIGIVWSDELEGFYYHAWPEVWVREWFWMDPTLDQPIADATHVKLLNGGIEAWPRLLPYLGRLEVEILDIE